MKLSGNTILITGGTSGIGYELAARLVEKGNTVLITGRSEEKLSEVSAKLPGVHTIKSDVSDAAEITKLYEKVSKEFPSLNVLINNAGIMRKINLQDPAIDIEDLTQEIDTNLSGPIRMTKIFLPLLQRQQKAAIVTISSGLAFVPFPLSPIYSATKAGIHFFTESLRVQLKHSHVQVFEVAPPGTETPLFRGDFSQQDLGGVKAMDVKVLVKHILAGLERDTLEIRPGVSNLLKIMSRVAPKFILSQIGKPAENMNKPA